MRIHKPTELPKNAYYIHDEEVSLKIIHFKISKYRYFIVNKDEQFHREIAKNRPMIL